MKERGRPCREEKGADILLRLEAVLIILSDSRGIWPQGKVYWPFLLPLLYRQAFLWDQLTLVTGKRMRVLRFWQLWHVLIVGS